MNKIPVLTLAPKNSHYHKEHTTVLGVPIERFIHPFVDSLSDTIVENLSEGCVWMESVLSNPLMEIKGIQHIGLAMQYYKEHQLPHDRPMNELLHLNEELQNRMHRSHPEVVLCSH